MADGNLLHTFLVTLPRPIHAALVEYARASRRSTKAAAAHLIEQSIRLKAGQK